ncbi:MAG: Glutathione S-transferase [Pseudomonadota bacterium]|jgi:glutathione S-transferase
MAITLHCLSGSPYAWRVMLALELKGLAYTPRWLSFDAGDFQSLDFADLNPRRRVPVLVDDGFVLYESAAIVEYLDDAYARTPRLFAADVQARAIERRLVREADQYVAPALEHLVEAVLFTPPEQRSPTQVAAGWTALRAELARWESLVDGEWLVGRLSAADITLFPLLALARRIALRTPEAVGGELTGPRLAAWAARVQALPLVQQTWPPHWR